jgi:hypothetical protein
MKATARAMIALLLSAGAAAPALAQSNVYPEASDCAALWTQADRISCRAQIPATGWRRPEVPYKSPTLQPNISGTYPQGPSYSNSGGNAPGSRKIQPIQPRVGQ